MYPLKRLIKSFYLFFYDSLLFSCVGLKEDGDRCCRHLVIAFHILIVDAFITLTWIRGFSRLLMLRRGCWMCRFKFPASPTSSHSLELYKGIRFFSFQIPQIDEFILQIPQKKIQSIKQLSASLAKPNPQKISMFSYFHCWQSKLILQNK